MNKRMAVAVFSLLVGSSAFAAETERYIVALRPMAARVKPSVLMRQVDAIPETRNVSSFTLVDAFAADLTAEEVAKLRKSLAVRLVEPVIERHILGSPDVTTDETRNAFGQTVPTGIDQIRARQVWNVSRGETINVVVVDTGVDYTHDDLSPNYAGGYNTFNDSADGRDDNGHGTHVAGIIAAADNDYGVVGVAPSVRLWSVKVLAADGKGSTENVIEGMEWIAGQKRRLGGRWVANLSLGSAESSTIEEQAFARAVDQGIVIVAASGNESTLGSAASVGYPAAYPGVIAVGAVDDNSAIANFSNQGPQLAVVAPGVRVLSSLKSGSGYIAGVTAGTSALSAAAVVGSKKGTISGQYVYCGFGRPEEFPPSVAGRIALIQRGEGITFAAKTRAAKDAGATAVVIFNNDTSIIGWTLIPADDPAAAEYDWPITVGISKADGERLRDSNQSISVSVRADDYGELSGTSMATPHVAGVVALLWGVAPAASPANLRLAITSTATDLGAPGVDPVFGAGQVNALDGAKQLAPASFGLPVTPEPTPAPSGRRSLIRGRR